MPGREQIQRAARHGVAVGAEDELARPHFTALDRELMADALAALVDAQRMLRGERVHEIVKLRRAGARRRIVVIEREDDALRTMHARAAHLLEVVDRHRRRRVGADDSDRRRRRPCRRREHRGRTLAERICSAIVFRSRRRLRRRARRGGAHNDGAACDPRRADQIADRVHRGAAHVERPIDRRDERDAGGGLRPESDRVEHDQRRHERTARHAGAGERRDGRCGTIAIHRAGPSGNP